MLRLSLRRRRQLLPWLFLGPGLLWLIVFFAIPLLNQANVGLLGEDGRLLASRTAVIAGITYNFLPFMILPLYVSLEKIDRRLIEAATDLYASRVTAFRRITLPLALPGIFAGSLLTFIPACGGATRQGVPPEVNVLATALLVVVLVLMGLNVALQRRLAARSLRLDAVEEPETATLVPARG